MLAQDECVSRRRLSVSEISTPYLSLRLVFMLIVQSSFWWLNPVKKIRMRELFLNVIVQPLCY